MNFEYSYPDMSCTPKSTLDMRFEHPACHLHDGVSGSGKTFRVAQILRLKNEILKNGEQIKNVVFCYATWQPVYFLLQQENTVSQWINMIPSVDDFVRMVEPYKNCGGSLVIIDDFMGHITPGMDEIVRVHSRHNNTSTFLLFQSLFPAQKLSRNISLNMRYIHVYKNPRENSQFGYLARQIMPQGYKWLVQAYYEATKKSIFCISS